MAADTQILFICWAVFPSVPCVITYGTHGRIISYIINTCPPGRGVGVCDIGEGSLIFMDRKTGKTCSVEAEAKLSWCLQCGSLKNKNVLESTTVIKYKRVSDAKNVFVSVIQSKSISAFINLNIAFPKLAQWKSGQMAALLKHHKSNQRGQS